MRYVKNLALLISAVALASVLGIASFAFSDDNPREKGGFDRGSNFMMVRMKEKLGLSDEQAAKLNTLFTGYRSNLLVLKKAKVKDRMDLRDKLFIGAPDKDLKETLDSLESDFTKIRDAKWAFIGSLRTILTPTQQAKVFEMMSEMKMRAGFEREGGNFKCQGCDNMGGQEKPMAGHGGMMDGEK